MCYKRKGSTRWQIRRRNLIGYGDTGVLATGVLDRRVAERMERVLDSVAERAVVEPSYRAIIEAVVEKRLTLADLSQADARGDLGALRAALVDPPLAEAVTRLRRAHAGRDRGRGVALGLDLLTQLAPARARLSYLRDPRQVTALCMAAETDAEGSQQRKRNSVRRTLLRAISLLLRAEAGRAERDRVFADVHYSGEDDTREVELSAAQLRALFEACDTEHTRDAGAGYDQLRTGLRLAAQLGLDRGVIFAGQRSGGEAGGLLVRQLKMWADDVDGTDVYAGEIYVDDRKAAGRRRTLPLTDSLCRDLLPFAAGKDEDQAVFTLNYGQLDVRWRRVREKAGLDGLRFKDLRAQFAIAAEKSGVPLTVASRAMGHGDEAMTRRYQRRQAVLSGDQAGAIERAMGLAA